MKIGALLPQAVLLLALIVIPAATQPLARVSAQESCTALLPLLIEATSEEVCRDINKNWACYGQELVEAGPPGLRFTGPADREPLAVFEQIGPQLPQGMVLLRVQATTQQAPLNLLVFGDLGVKSLGAATFAAAAKSASLLCSNTPSGIVIQTKERRRGAVKINGVEIILGSTAFVTLAPDNLMTVINIEGNVAVAINGGPPQSIPEGAQMRIPQSNNPTTVIGPEPSLVVDSPVLQFLAREPQGLRRVGDPNTGDPSPEARVPPCGGTIQFGETLTQETFTLGQECLFTFTVNLNNVATIELEALDAGSDAQLDPWVDLRDPDQTLLGSNNDIAKDERNSRLCNYSLPPRTGIYTIVARAAGNNSKGRFSLTLDDQTACTPPEPRCTLLTPALNLRSGPDVTYPIIKTLTAAARLKPLGRNADSAWFYVEDLAEATFGWISAAPRYLACENGFAPPVTVTPPGTITPPPAHTRTAETPTPGFACPQSALQKRYNLPGGDGLPCAPIFSNETPPSSTPVVATPTPKPGIKDPPLPGP